jgi:excisionase family DNA binding protein
MKAIDEPQHLCLKTAADQEIPLPTPVFEFLAQVMLGLKQGQTMLLVPVEESFTTQAAADYLGISRQYLAKVIEAGDILHHKVGTHNRLYLKDLLT